MREDSKRRIGSLIRRSFFLIRLLKTQVIASPRHWQKAGAIRPLVFYAILHCEPSHSAGVNHFAAAHLSSS